MHSKKWPCLIHSRRPLAWVQVEVDRYQAIMRLTHITLDRRISTVLLEQSPLKCLEYANRRIDIVVIDLGPENPRLRSLGLNLQHMVHIVDTLGLDKQLNGLPYQFHVLDVFEASLYFSSLVDLFPIAIRSSQSLKTITSQNSF
jgi:hypothetical protein